MDPAEYDRLSNLLMIGKLHELQQELGPFLAADDLDARFLNANFSIGASETGPLFDKRTVDELKVLAARFHAKSLYALAWRYRHGDGVDADLTQFRNLLTAAALLGHKDAVSDLAKFLEMELGWSGFSDRFAPVEHGRG